MDGDLIWSNLLGKGIVFEKNWYSSTVTVGLGKSRHGCSPHEVEPWESKAAGFQILRFVSGLVR